MYSFKKCKDSAAEGGGFMPEYYVPKRRCQLECDKPLHRGEGVKMNNFSVTYFLNGPKGQELPWLERILFA